MKFMVIVKATKESEAGEMPSEQLLKEMGAFNEELVKAGVMLAGEGLHPSSKGARVQFDGPKRKVVDGPFAEAKELIGGFYIVEVASLDEAISWALRCPVGLGSANVLEIRPLTEMTDIPPALLELTTRKWDEGTEHFPPTTFPLQLSYQ